MGTRIRNNRISLRPSRWRECAVCGFEYPESEMYLHNGSFICFEHDADDNRVRQAESFETTERPRMLDELPEEKLN